MSSNEYAISLKTNRLIKKSTANYRKLKKLNQIKEIEPRAQLRAQPTPEPDSPEPEPDSPEPDSPGTEFNERDLQLKLAELSTTVVQRNMKKIIRSQKLSDKEYDLLLKKMLYEKLCVRATPPVKPTKKKKKFKIVQPSSSSESESD